MPDFNKPAQVDPLRKKKEELATEIKQHISGIFTKLEKQGGVIEYGSEGWEVINFKDEFELEGRDDVVKAVMQQDSPSTEGATVEINVVTEYDGEEEEHELGDLSIDDMLNVYEALKEIL